MTYDHYIAVDWAQSNMAVARLTKQSVKPTVKDVPANLEDLKVYLTSLRGRKILTFEETTTAHWLYVELRDLVDEILICDPYRNKLLSEGPKTDKIDACKLVELLRANLLKPVYHSCDELIALRKLVSGYDDMIQRGVRLKNQRSALLRGLGLAKGEKLAAHNAVESFVMVNLERAIDAYESDRALYETEFERQIKKSMMLRWLKQIPGIGAIGSVKLGAAIVDGARFPSVQHFHSYSGLVRHDRISGGRSYGTKKPRYRRDVKAVFKTAALSATMNDCCFTPYYHYLIDERHYPEHQARHALTRKISTAVFGVMKNKTKFNPEAIGALKALSK